MNIVSVTGHAPNKKLIDIISDEHAKRKREEYYKQLEEDSDEEAETEIVWLDAPKIMHISA